MNGRPYSSRAALQLMGELLVLCSILLLFMPKVTYGLPQGDDCHDSDGPCSSCPCPPEASPGDGNEHPTQTANPVNFLLNSAVERAVDLSVPGTVLGWSHMRTYDSRLSRGISNEFDLEGIRWQGGGTNSYLVENGSNIDLYAGARAKRIFTLSGGNYIPPADSPVTMVKSGSDDEEEFIVTNTETGDITIFYSFHTDISVQNRGRLKERTNRALVAKGEYGTTYGYYSNGLTAWAMPPQGWLIEYDYYTSGSETNRLQSVSVYAVG
jgi:hypothetical protein